MRMSYISGNSGKHRMQSFTSEIQRVRERSPYPYLESKEVGVFIIFCVVRYLRARVSLAVEMLVLSMGVQRVSCRRVHSIFQVFSL